MLEVVEEEGTPRGKALPEEGGRALPEVTLDVLTNDSEGDVFTISVGLMTDMMGLCPEADTSVVAAGLSQSLVLVLNTGKENVGWDADIVVVATLRDNQSSGRADSFGIWTSICHRQMVRILDISSYLNIALILCIHLPFIQTQKCYNDNICTYFGRINLKSVCNGNTSIQSIYIYACKCSSNLTALCRFGHLFDRTDLMYLSHNLKRPLKYNFVSITFFLLAYTIIYSLFHHLIF